MTLPKLLLTAALSIFVSISEGADQSSSLTTSCQKGVCASEFMNLFQIVDDADKCKQACIDGKDCKYYTYSNVTNYCLQYSSCPTVDIMKLSMPPNMFLEPGDLSTYSTCKFTQYVLEKWVDIKGKPSKQSSTGWGGSSSRAVDGNKRADWGGGSCTHTHGQNKPWWEVDLQEDVDIGSVELVNRHDCCWTRLRTFKVLVDGKECASGGSTSRGEYKLVKCGMKGRNLRIQLNHHDALTLCEVGVRQMEYVDVTNATWFL